jgi:glycosyltransferase involved in cell wall biosynthesis
MKNSPDWRAKFDEHKICVLIPTYNNSGTLGQLIRDLSEFTSNILVVNDGSTDDTFAVLSHFPDVKLLSYEKNMGKGWALRKGFVFARDSGFRYAITIDSDGQHFARDLPVFIKDLQLNGDGIIIGARNMDQLSVPEESKNGNRVSSFWFKVISGNDLPDTQSGYRLYPVHLFKSMKFLTRKYEFEIEVIVRSSWKGIPVRTVPVIVYYAPKESRISHFRPLEDVTRISILNTVFVFITFLWIKPRNFFRIIFQKKKLKEALRAQFFNTGESDLLKSSSVAFGVFMGIVPIWGFQLVVAIFLAVLLRLNKALVIIAANISIPPMIPIIIFLSYKMGSVWMGERRITMEFNSELSLEAIRANLEQYIYGSITLAIIAGLLAGLIAWVTLKIMKRRHSGKLIS